MKIWFHTRVTRNLANNDVKLNWKVGKPKKHILKEVFSLWYFNIYYERSTNFNGEDEIAFSWFLIETLEILFLNSWYLFFFKNCLEFGFS